MTTGEVKNLQTGRRKISKVTEEHLVALVDERLDVFEQGLVNLAEATKRRFDELAEKVDRLCKHLGVK